jgi:hypothetical protein
MLLLPTDDAVAVTSPFARPLHFLGLEIVVAVCFALTLLHVVRAYRRGDRYPAFQWLVILAYGVLMELIAFTFYQNYEHATFTVQLYRGQLPLYIPLVYIVFHYTGLKAVERLHLGAAAVARLVGVAIALLDVPFDVVGVAAGWWSWSSHDPNLAHRWLGVPVTSYYWYLAFGAVLALLSRALRRRVARRPLAAYVALAPLVALAIVALGIVAFIPFHVLVALGAGPGVIVAAHLAACTALAVVVRPTRVEPAPRFVVQIAIVLPAWMALVAVTLLLASPGGDADRSALLARLLVTLSAATGGLALARFLPLRPRPIAATGTPPLTSAPANRENGG